MGGHLTKVAAFLKGYMPIIRPDAPVVKTASKAAVTPVLPVPVVPAALPDPVSIISAMDAKRAQIAALKIQLAKAHADLDGLIGHHNRIK